MKRFILIIIISFFAGSALFLAFGIAKKIRDVKQIEEKIKTLPSFTFLTLDNEEFSSEEIMSGPLLIVRFHPECEHCHYEISELIKNHSDLSEGLILLVSDAPSDSIREFMELYSGFRVAGILPLADPFFQFGKNFGNDIVPSNYLYNRNLSLVRVFYGEVKHDVITRLMMKDETE